ncbi:MAG TPA: PGF-CTERM sorting domain-containing protein, partial [Methanosarcina sp.]|nr:PGF-CTERM sorting domain-containing protein [Methanosarcina sp.]
ETDDEEEPTEEVTETEEGVTPTEEEPTETEETEPTEEEEPAPGFGVVLGLVGLLAVVYLVRRNN